MVRPCIPRNEYACKFGCGVAFEKGDATKKCRHQKKCLLNPENKPSIVNNTTNNTTNNDNSTTNNTTNNTTNITINVVLPFGEEDMESVVDGMLASKLARIVADPEHALTEMMPDLIWFNKEKPHNNIFVHGGVTFKMKLPNGSIVEPPSPKECLQVAMKHYQNIVDRAMSEGVLGPIFERLNEYYARAIHNGKTIKVSKYSPFVENMSDNEVNPETLASWLVDSIKLMTKVHKQGRRPMRTSEQIVNSNT